MEDFNIEEEFRVLVNNGWLTEHEAQKFCGDKNIVSAMNLSTSPVKSNIFNALKLVPFGNVKVVILGKDPYPNPKHAHGLAFSSLDTATPDSLKNIFKAIDRAYGSKLFANAKNNLTNWAKDGVLLLNTGLTYQTVNKSKIDDKKAADLLQAKTQKEHMKIWKPFIKLVIQKVLTIKDRPVVMMLWGNDAHNIVFSNIKDKEFKNLCHSRDAITVPNTSVVLLQTSHPSPLSVNRGGDFPATAPEHFRQCNKILGTNAVNWINL